MPQNSFLQSPFAALVREQEQEQQSLIGSDPVKDVEIPDLSAAKAEPAPAPATPSAPKKAKGKQSLLPPDELRPLFEATASHFDVPVNVLMAIAQQESSYNANAANAESGAAGMVQYVGATAKSLGINPRDPNEAIPAAAMQIRERMDKGLTLDDAVREHFAGPDRKLWGPKTAAYGDEVLGKADEIGRTLYGDAPSEKAAPTVEPGKGIGALPVTPEYLKAMKAQWNGATPAERKKMEKLRGYPGHIARQLNKEQKPAAPKDGPLSIFAQMQPTPIQGMQPDSGSAMDMLDQSAEARTRRLIRGGMEGKTAEAVARDAARRGVLPGQEQGAGQTIGKTDFDFATRKAYNEDPVLSNPVVRAAVKGYEGYKQGVLGINEFAGEVMGADISGQRGMADASRAKVEAMGEKGGYGQRMFEGAVSSIAQQLPALIGGAVTGAEAVPLAAMFAQSFGREYSDGRAAGQDKEQATTRAALYGTFEVLGERFGLKNAIAGLRGAAMGAETKDVATQMAKALLKEIPGEQMTTLGQFLTDKLPDGVGLNPEADLAQYLQQAADTMVQTVLQGGMMTGGATAGSALANRARGERPAMPEAQQQERVEPTLGDVPVNAGTPAAPSGPLLSALESAAPAVEADNWSAQVMGDDGVMHSIDSRTGVVMAGPEAAPTGLLEGAVADAAEQHAADPAPAPILPEAEPAAPDYSTMALPDLQARVKEIGAASQQSPEQRKAFAPERKAIEQEIAARGKQAIADSKPAEEAKSAGPFEDIKQANRMMMLYATETGVPHEVVESDGVFRIKPLEANDGIDTAGADGRPDGLGRSGEPAAQLGSGDGVRLAGSGDVPGAGVRVPRTAGQRTDNDSDHRVADDGTADRDAPVAQSPEDTRPAENPYRTYQAPSREKADAYVEKHGISEEKFEVVQTGPKRWQVLPRLASSIPKQEVAADVSEPTQVPEKAPVARGKESAVKADKPAAAPATPEAGAKGALARRRALNEKQDEAVRQAAENIAKRKAAKAKPAPQPVAIVKEKGGRAADVEKTAAALPPVAEGFKRLYRAESPTVKFDDVFNADGLAEFKTDKPGQRYTPDLKYADYYRLSYGKDAVIRYVDVPNAVAEQGKLDESEYVIDAESAAALPQQEAVAEQKQEKAKPKHAKPKAKAEPVVEADSDTLQEEAEEVKYSATLDTDSITAVSPAIQKLADKGAIVLHDDASTLPIKGKVPQGVQALTTSDGTIHVVAKSLSGNDMAVVLHEAFHAGVKPLVGSEQWGELMKRLGALHRHGEQSSGKAREFWGKARARVATAKAKGAVADGMEVEEFGAYAIEEYESAPLTVRKWVDDLVGLVKAWVLRLFGKQLGQVTPAQLSGLAKLALLDVQATRMEPAFSTDDQIKGLTARATGKTDPITRKPVFEVKDADGNLVNIMRSADDAESAVALTQKIMAMRAQEVAQAPAMRVEAPRAAKSDEPRSNWKIYRGKVDSLDGADDFLYHVTSYPAARQILRTGLVPDAGRMFGGGYEGHSAGRVFLTDRDGVNFWRERVEQALFSDHDNPPAVAVLRIPKNLVKNTQPDPAGTRDARANAYFVEGETVFSVDRRAEERAAADRRKRTIEVDGERRPIYDANGRLVASDFMGQMRFWNWFKDSAIKNDHGEPVQLFHGTRGDFSEFDPDKMGSTDLGYYGSGFYFTAVPETAAAYGGQAVMPVYVALQNPYIWPEGREPAADMHETFAITQQLKKEGYDGVVVRNKEMDGENGRNFYEVIAFEPEQIKSAVGNNQQFDPDNADIRYSVAGAPQPLPPQQQSFAPPEDGILGRIKASLNDFQGVIQDNMNRVKQIQDRISEQTGIKELRSDFYLAWDNLPGRVASRKEDFQKKMLEPMMERLGKSGYTQDQLVSLLHAQHAAERNAKIREINPLYEHGSGMTDKSAAEILAQYPEDQHEKLYNIATNARQIARAALRMKLASGRISQDDYDAIAKAYDFYVPLKGDGEHGPGMQRAMGHDERDEKILENITRDYEQSLIVSERNMAYQTLLHLILEHPDDSIWTARVPPKGRRVVKEGGFYVVYKDGMRLGHFKSQVEAERQSELWAAMQQDDILNFEVENATGEKVQEYVKPLQDHEIMVYVKGDAVRLQINDKKMALQLRPIFKGKSVGLIRFAADALRGLIRHFSVVYTGKNPYFILKNAIRDITTGTVNMTGNHGAMVAAKAWAKYPQAWAAMLQYAVTDNAPSGFNGDMGGHFREYRMHGGKVGASYMSDLDRQAKSLQRMFDDGKGVIGYTKDGRIDKAAWIASRKAIGGLAHVIEVLNQAFENAMRLALFATLRENGVKPGRAAQAAKGVTVNFDRRGSAINALGMAYLFINPAIQGTANMTKVMVKGEHKYQAWSVVSMIVGGGVYAALHGMDDDKDRWLGMRWDERTKNIIIRVGENSITIPMSQEYAPFYAIGVATGEMMRGESKAKAASNVLTSFFDAYYPMQGAVRPDSDNPALDFLMAHVPTVARLPMQVAVNRNSFGSKVVPETENTKNRPDNLKMNRRTKGTVYDKVAQALSDGDYENDVSKVSPETLKTAWQTYTGGIGRFLADTGSFVSLAAEDGLELERADIPFASDFYKADKLTPISSRFYDLADEARKATDEFTAAQKAGDKDAMKQFADDKVKSRQRALAKMVQSTSKVQGLYGELAVNINADKKLSTAEKRTQLKELEAKQEAIYRRAIEALSK